MGDKCQYQIRKQDQDCLMKYTKEIMIINKIGNTLQEEEIQKEKTRER